jgi:hypothetical protein
MAGLAAAVAFAAGSATTALGQCVNNGGNYGFTVSSGTIVPGDTDSGNHFDDGTTAVAMPFSWSFYGTSYNTVYVSSNGDVQFTTSGDYPEDYFNSCPLPSTSFDATILAYWDDQRTDNNGTSGEGIFTSVSGVAPNRIFNIEFRTSYFNGRQAANYEVRLYEGQTRFDCIYGSMQTGGSGATIGCQESGAGRTTQYACNTNTNNAPAAGVMLVFDCIDPTTPQLGLSLSSSGGFPGESVVAHATVTPGTPSTAPYAVSLDASALNAGTVTLYDDGTHGDSTAGDLVYTNSLTVGAGAANGSAVVTATLTDAASPPHVVTAAAAYHVGYCASATNYQACDAFYEYISNVTLGSINSSSDCTRPSYEDNTAQSTTMAAGDSAPISVMIGTPFQFDQCTAWVDWNGNGVFTDAGEVFPLDPFQLGEGENTFNGTIVVPAGTTAGPKRMRVMVAFDEDPVPCTDPATTEYGTIDDYTIVVAPSGPVCGTADFNCDGDVGTDQDISAFFACLSGTCPAAPCHNSADFNGDGDVGTDADIGAFFRVLSGGNC